MPLTSRIYPLVACALFVAPTASHHPVSPGYTYDIVNRTKTVNPMSGTTDVVSLRAHVAMDGAGNARIDIVETTQNPRWGPGDYVIVSGGKMIVVSPLAKQYLDLGTDAGMSQLSEVMREREMQMTMTIGKFAFDTLTGVDTIDGRLAHHYHMSQAGSMSMTGARPMDIALTSETDYEVAREHVPTAAPPVGPGSPLSISPMIPHDVALRMHNAMLGMHGFVVRETAHTTSIVMGSTIEQTRTTEILNLQEIDVPPQSAVPPEGYTKTTLAARMHALTGN